MTRLSRATSAIVAFLIVVLIVAGGAWALVRFGRLDGLTSLDLTKIWTSADDGSLVLGVVTVIGWVAWTMATLSLVSEALAVLSSRRWRLRLPGLGVFTPASAVLITAIVGLVTPQLTVPATALELSVEPATEPPVVTVANQERATPTQVAGRSHLVQVGDDLWSLAEQYYGDGTRWRDIAAANQTILLDSVDLLQPGVLLVIPEAAVEPLTGGVEVQPGDTLSQLAEEHLGDAQRWPDLVQANPRITDPDAIEPGWVLALPPAQPADPLGAAPVVETPAPVEPSDQTSTEAPVDSPGPTPTEAPVDSTQTEVPGDATSTDAPVELEPPCPIPEAADDESSGQWAAVLPSSLGVLLAAGLGGAFAWRRRQQSAQRPLGRRLPVVPEPARLTGSALAAALAEVDQAELPTTLPVTAVAIGETASGPLWCDLEDNAVTWLGGEDADDLALACAIALSLVGEQRSETVEVVAAGADLGWLSSLDEPRLRLASEISSGAELLAEVIATRTEELPEGCTLAELRADPVRAAAWAPLVFIFASPPDRRLPTALSLLGVSVVICGGAAEPPTGVKVIRLGADQAEEVESGQRFDPYQVTAPARRALLELFETANSTEYPPAWWWDQTPASELPTILPTAAWPASVEELPVVTSLASEHPVVRLLGPVELTGARGEPPSRAVKQCEEYCAWILENPGASSLAMASSLMVAEPTRRSNMSRLRGWLGDDDRGAAYLPDAYSGRITLHPGVTSDWEQLQLWIGSGINRVGDAVLIDALGLVRGAPLADAAPGQWHWAEQLRADMVATIRDIGVLLGRRATAAENLELAQWALDRALLAAPDDELLLGVQIQIANQAGDRGRVDQLVLQLTRRARGLGVDLADETVQLLQEVVEGRARLRRA